MDSRRTTKKVGRKKDKSWRWQRQSAQTTTVDSNEVAGEFACFFGVIRCGTAWYIAKYPIFHIMRYHKIRYVEISYELQYPGLRGLTSRHRIPPKYCFSIPNTSNSWYLLLLKQVKRSCAQKRWRHTQKNGNQTPTINRRRWRQTLFGTAENHEQNVPETTYYGERIGVTG